MLNAYFTKKFKFMQFRVMTILMIINKVSTYNGKQYALTLQINQDPEINKTLLWHLSPAGY